MKQPKKEHIIRRLLWEARPIWKWLLLAALLCIGVIVCELGACIFKIIL